MSLKSEWRKKAEALVKEGKTAKQIGELIGNPFKDDKSLRAKISQIKATFARIEALEDEDKTVLQEEAALAGIPLENVNYYWYKNKRVSINASNDKTVEEVLFDAVEDMKQHAPSYPPITRNFAYEETLLVIDPADIHIGKLAKMIEVGSDYDMQVAVQRVMEGVKSLVSMATTFGVQKIVLTIGGDVLHTDNKRRTTTSGTPQDTDGMWYEHFNFARRMYVDIIETLLSVADVHVIHNMSNHDNVLGWALAQTVEAHFSKCKNTTFNVTPMPRKGLLWHDNLIVFTHGEEKEHLLALSVPHEFPQEWALSKFRYVHKQHIHHKTSKDHISINITTSRSVSGPDSWHMANLYAHAPKAVECFLYGKGKGQFASFAHFF